MIRGKYIADGAAETVKWDLKSKGYLHAEDSDGQWQPFSLDGTPVTSVVLEGRHSVKVLNDLAKRAILFVLGVGENPRLDPLPVWETYSKTFGASAWSISDSDLSLPIRATGMRVGVNAVNCQFHQNLSVAFFREAAHTNRVYPPVTFLPSTNLNIFQLPFTTPYWTFSGEARSGLVADTAHTVYLTYQVLYNHVDQLKYESYMNCSATGAPLLAAATLVDMWEMDIGSAMLMNFAWSVTFADALNTKYADIMIKPIVADAARVGGKNTIVLAGAQDVDDGSGHFTSTQQSSIRVAGRQVIQLMNNDATKTVTAIRVEARGAMV